MLLLFVLMSVVSAMNIADYTPLFNKWVSQFHMRFEDDFHRGNVFSKWVSNHIYIEKTNSLNLTYSLGHNQFSGMDSTDFSNHLGYSSLAMMTRIGTPVYIFENIAESQHLRRVASLDAIPSSIDWVAKGGVTPVKDQGQCGSCWSFSTTGALEGAFFITHGVLKSFSEQQLVDCDTLGNGGRDHGCNGGLMDNAFTWIGKNNGLCTEADYPYVSGTTKSADTCQTKCSIVAGSDVTKYVDVATKSDQALMTAIAQQPVSIAIEADQRDFQLYKSGVFTGTCGTNLDHGVLVVGYGTENGLDYYKVKNSWSNTWGEGGYIRLGRGSEYNAGSGQCGILLQASYPVL